MRSLGSTQAPGARETKMTPDPPVFKDRRYHRRKEALRGTRLKLRRTFEKVFWREITWERAAPRCYRWIREHEGLQAAGRWYLDVGVGIDGGFGIEERGPLIQARTIGLDLEPFERVQVRGSARALPFADGTFDGVFCQGVLHLVVEPLLVVRELARVVRPGGVIFVTTAFLEGHMEAPTDSVRLTLSALKEMLQDFEEVQAGASRGPSSALAWVVRDYLTFLLSPGPRWNNAVRLFLNWPLFPIKYLDLVAGRRSQAHRLAAEVFFLGIKRYPARAAR
jgi:SAM-dependent methyltransferase